MMTDTREAWRPGAGWRHVAGSVWEHVGGARIHVLGVVKLKDGSFLATNKWPESREFQRILLINGGNRKRALMTWARRWEEFKRGELKHDE